METYRSSDAVRDTFQSSPFVETGWVTLGSIAEAKTSADHKQEGVTCEGSEINGLVRADFLGDAIRRV
jgi:hypothetical protein